MKIKIYAVINWEEGNPNITALDFLPLIMFDKQKLERIFQSIKDFPEIRSAKIIEFESGEIAIDETIYSSKQNASS